MLAIPFGIMQEEILGAKRVLGVKQQVIARCMIEGGKATEVWPCWIIISVSLVKAGSACVLVRTTAKGLGSDWYIGSGTGVLTVVRALLEQLGSCELVYFGDTANAPYGTKSAAIIERFARQGVDFLLEAGATQIVVACSTVASVALASLMSKYQLPFFSALTPAVKTALEGSTRLKIGIIGSTALVRSQTWQQEIHRLAPQARAFAVDGSLLSVMVEAGWHKKPETAMIIRKCLHGLKTSQIDTLILSEPHHRLLRKTIQGKIGARVHLVDVCRELARATTLALEEKAESIDGKSPFSATPRFCVSDLNQQVHRNAKLFFQGNLRLEWSCGS